MAKKRLTQEGINELKEELNNLKNVERLKVIEELKEARAQGDLSENADYDAARNRQSQVESRISELENILANVEVLEKPVLADGVVVGTKVTILDLSDNKKYVYMIVNPTEANPMAATNKKLSNESPLAVALSKHRVGEVVTVKVKVPYQVKILKIE